ncbi:DUF2802 domain-containing protein [Tepidiphilus olei]|uniref:DUF2802 domain-containing protein n=1 Tax=Tepidiphilus olei TaxID=2502184 RepID=UPI00115D17AA|nr:DUF2802 domain-containing protein [Tepidiphilus olei]
MQWVIGGILVASIAWVMFEVVRWWRARRRNQTKGTINATASDVPGATPALFALDLAVKTIERRCEALQRDLEEHARREQEILERLNRLEASAAASTSATGPVEPLAASPEYVEPMVLARRGLDAPAIAARCGITLGEAELLVAMARGEGRSEP